LTRSAEQVLETGYDPGSNDSFVHGSSLFQRTFASQTHADKRPRVLEEGIDEQVRQISSASKRPDLLRPEMMLYRDFAAERLDGAPWGGGETSVHIRTVVGRRLPICYGHNTSRGTLTFAGSLTAAMYPETMNALAHEPASQVVAACDGAVW
jgi:hypothetical protein